MSVHVYDWCKKRGYYGRTGDLSHVLLDKGVLCVPEGSHDEFLAEYARGVVQGGKYSCVVEYKPKVFRMFYDLDIVASPGLAEAMTKGDFSEDVHTVFKTVCGVTADLFDVERTEVIMCVSNFTKKAKEGVKVGIHLTFGSIFVTSTIALFVRSKVLEKLSELQNPFVNDWEQIVDAAVHKGSGMRLPWAAKPEEPKRVYVPMLKYILDRKEEMTHELLDVSGFAATRKILSEVSLRTRGVVTKLLIETELGDTESPSHPESLKHESLRQYENVVAELEKIIPEEYGGKITGVLKTDHVYMFRHSSKFCSNVGRHHHSSNTYFMVTRNGMHQRCYSRKVVFEEGRCPCSLYKGEVMKVPKKILDELFPQEPSEPKDRVVSPMPSQITNKSYRVIEEYATRTPKVKKKAQKKPAKISLADLMKTTH
ncbi:DNA primase [Acanthocystis turfacea Chlorella virus TN603.4.2]|nr:DNA primase [Acanthocystis turfacea Chlorella virus TN603.4.2]